MFLRPLKHHGIVYGRKALSSTVTWSLVGNAAELLSAMQLDFFKLLSAVMSP
jgi:hypothetical protein